MNGFCGALGSQMCDDLNDSRDKAPMNMLPEAFAPTDCEGNLQALIFAEEHIFHHDESHSLALAIDGHILEQRVDQPQHANQVCGLIVSEGLDSIRDVDGFYTLALFDTSARNLTLLRDPWGSQTIYYLQDERGFAFSTKITDLVPLIRGSIQANLESTARFLLHGRSPKETETFFAQIQQVPPRTQFIIAYGGTTVATERGFHSPLQLTETDSTLTWEEAVARARGLLREAVTNTIRHIEQPGFTLSGGIDSSVGVMLARDIRPNQELNTYSYVTKARASIDEERYMDAVNGRANSIEHKLTMGAKDYFDEMPRSVAALGTPLVGSSQLAQFLLYRMAESDSVDVMLNGVEADSAFCGHTYFLVDRVLELVTKRDIRATAKLIRGIIASSSPLQRKILILGAVQRLPRWLNRPIMMAFQPTRSHKWLGFTAPRDVAELSNLPHKARSKRRVQEHMRYQLSHDRHLRYAEMCGAAFSIYSRTPFLHRKLNEFMLTLPSEFLISESGETKQFLRPVVEGIIPDSVLNRRDKIGFEAPTREWLISEEARVRDYLELGVTMRILAPNHGLLEKKNFATIDRTISYIEWARTFSVEMS